MTPTLPPAGTIGLTQVQGDVGKFIEFGQWINGDGFKKWEHAFVLLPGGFILEAEPGGARIRPFHYSTVYWCNSIYNASPQVKNASPILLTQNAQLLKGTPYSFLDYEAIFLHRLHLDVPGLQGYIASSKHQICSQLADSYYYQLGAHVFTDNRWPGYVTPLALFNRDQQLLAA